MVFSPESLYGLKKGFAKASNGLPNQTASIKLLTSLSLIDFCRISFCVSISVIECNQGSKPTVIFFLTFFCNQENGEFLVMFSIVKKDWLTSCRI